MQLKMDLESRHSWGGLSNLTSALIWAKYGYWSKGYEPPEWYDKELELAELVVDIVQPPDTEYEVSFDSVVPGEVTGKFCVWDTANPWVEAWEVGFRSKSKENAEKNYQVEYLKHKELHNGVINALLHYKNTGEPVEPDWLPKGGKTNFHWLNRDYKKEDYRGFRKLLRGNEVLQQVQDK